MSLVRLGDVLQVQNGFAFSSENFRGPGRGMPLIRIRDLGTDTTEATYDGPYREEFVVNPGDLLIGMDGDFECHWWRGPRALLNQRVCRLQHFADEIDPEFVHFWIRKELTAIHAGTAFVTVKHLSSKQVANLQLQLPPLSEQKRIVAVLNRAASLKRLAGQAQAKTRELLPALFANIFGDPATNPKGWPVVALGDCFAVKGGKRLPASQNYAEAETSHPYIRGTDIHAGHVDGSNLRFIDEVTHASISRYVVARGDVVITIAGKIGVAAPVPTQLAGANLTENAAMIRCLPGIEAEPTFVAAQINSPLVQRQIEALTGRVTVAKLALERLKTLRLFLPDVKVQREFAERIYSVRSISRLAERAATLGEHSSASLMSRLLAA